MGGLTNKFKRLKTVSKEEGFKAVISRALYLCAFRAGWFNDHPLLGRLIELRGNMVKLDGCRFSVDNPSIHTGIKSRFALGFYEDKERKAVRRFLNPDLPAIELGASIGVVSCVTNKKLKNPKNHIVVEANPELIPILTKNRDLNRCSFTILNKAYSPDSKEVVFYIHDRFINGSAQRASGRSLSIPSVSLKDIFEQFKFKCANIICDIEGGEVDLIKEKNLLSEKIFQLIVEVHPSDVGEEAIKKFRQELESAGFKKIRTGSYSTVLVFENSRLKSLFGGPQ